MTNKSTQHVPRIAFTGKLRTGKSDAAMHVFTSFDFTTLSFGSKLKSAADDLFYWSDVYGPDEASPGGRIKKPRKLYQDFGQAMRELDANIWIGYVEGLMHASEERRSTKGIVIDDLRQPNEYEWAKANGFKVIRITSDEETRLKRARERGDVFKVEDLSHDTEQHVDSFDVDYEIENNGSYSDLLLAVDRITREIIDDFSDGR